MNYLKSLTFVFFLSVCSLGFTQSKVAHIDSQSLISQMPEVKEAQAQICLLYTSPSPRDDELSRMPSSA